MKLKGNSVKSWVGVNPHAMDVMWLSQRFRCLRREVRHFSMGPDARPVENSAGGQGFPFSDLASHKANNPSPNEPPSWDVVLMSSGSSRALDPRPWRTSAGPEAQRPIVEGFSMDRRESQGWRIHHETHTDHILISFLHRLGPDPLHQNVPGWWDRQSSHPAVSLEVLAEAIEKHPTAFTGKSAFLDRPWACCTFGAKHLQMCGGPAGDPSDWPASCWCSFKVSQSS